MPPAPEHLLLKSKLDNDNKLADIEAAFPHSDLHLMLATDDIPNNKHRRANIRKRLSAPGALFKRVCWLILLLLLLLLLLLFFFFFLLLFYALACCFPLPLPPIASLTPPPFFFPLDTSVVDGATSTAVLL